jgi:hypothetical protein
VTAGTSAGYAADRLRLEASEYERLAKCAREEARRYELARRTEASVEARLQALGTLGWRVLADRRWAGSKRANVDFLLVGPGGVVVADVKAWRDLEVRHDSLFCQDECRDDEVGKLLGLTDQVQDSVGLLGLTRQALWPALVFAGRRLDERAAGVDLVGEANVAAWVSRLGRRLDEDQVDAVATVLSQDFPPYDAPPPTPVKVAKRRIVMPRLSRGSGLDRLDQPQSPDELFDVNELSDALLEAELAKPIESWMTFLHPSQLKLVNTSHSGPARVRGPAGTGKTVVGLHRAAYLAERNPKRVLFVTYVRTLPIVMSGLCRRMSPVAADNIEFTNLHRVAIDIVEKAGARSRIDGQKARKAFYAAWMAVAKGSVLTKLDARPSYWQEEIDYIIKGRGLTDFEEYAALSRLGRRTPMRAEHRATMWELYVEYERQLGLAEVHDFTDVLIMARDFVRDGAVTLDYGAVVVDEVQDLNLVGLQFLHAIAGDGPDGLMVIGDGQQAVYPGGFTLTEAGISVAGRAAVLRSNYRNTVEILDAAATIISDDQYDDLDDEPVAGRRDTEAVRRGGTVLTVRAADRVSLEAALVKQIKDTERFLRVPLGDLAVLVATRKELEHYSAVLRRAGISYVDLRDYDGITSDHVKIGTFKRAKGLEFKYALLPGLVEGPRRRQAGESDESYRERMERERRELYVGMTRARDGLWLGYVEN